MAECSFEIGISLRIERIPDIRPVNGDGCDALADVEAQMREWWSRHTVSHG
jgi:hypothetical protein